MTIDTINGIICAIHSTHEQTKLRTQHCSTLWRQQRLFCSGCPLLADLDLDFGFFFFLTQAFLHFSNTLCAFLFKIVRQSSCILQRHIITARHSADIFAAMVTACSPHRHHHHHHHTGSPSQEGKKNKRACCSLFQARVLQMRERLECRLPWVTKEKETAMACKPSCNLVLRRVHRVPSNQTQPVMLAHTAVAVFSWQELLDSSFDRGQEPQQRNTMDV